MGQKGTVCEASKNDPSNVMVQFPGSGNQVPEKIPVSALKILPNGRISGNMVGSTSRGIGDDLEMPGNSGSMGMILLIGLFVVILICAGLGGAYMLLKDDGGGRDSFVDLEAGRGP